MCVFPSFQIAKMLNRERYALVLGMNSFVGTILQSILTGIVVSSKSLQLTIISQVLSSRDELYALHLIYECTESRILHELYLEYREFLRDLK